ncbi:ABC-three component system protein [uncultured Roseobacter sp.]|uniref:ABC-three component system protein n=1 Tax=uncultured Roseobacter sp. TaxID=114847 RepID=UPI0026185DAB|nr:ABC-three component system protein [uncultured Roseobacter sp.]
MTEFSQIPGLLDRLDKEILHGDACVEGFIDDLQMFQDRRSSGSLVGLEAKLTDAERQDQLESALMKKEHFAKLLAKMQHYPSAQKIFALFLARINDVFENHIVPHVSLLDRQEVDQIIEERIIQPTLSDMGSGFEHFTITHAHIRGMIYWLADRCYVRWS